MLAFPGKKKKKLYCDKLVIMTLLFKDKFKEGCSYEVRVQVKLTLCVLFPNFQKPCDLSSGT